jgi:peptidoglycan/LPS O-acetylase OafA/YrhL
MSATQDPQKRETGRMADDKSQSRLEWVDYARGLGILNVVIWHVLYGVYAAKLGMPASFQGYWDRYDIFALRYMTIFFTVSGVFLPWSLRKGLGEVAKDKLRTLVYPYMVWCTITLTVGTWMASQTNQGMTLRDWPQIFYWPPMIYWFLYVLFFITIFQLVMYRLGLGVWPLLILSAAGLVAAETYDVTEIYADKTTYLLVQFGFFTVWFALGVKLSDFLIHRLPRMPFFVVLGPAVVCTAIALYLTAFGYAGPGVIWVRILGGIASSIGAVLVSVLLAHFRFRILRVLQVLGQISLEIYLTHVLVLAAVRIALLNAHVTNMWVHIFAGVGVTLAATSGLALAVRRWKINYIFTWPKPRPSVPEPA